MKEAVFDLDPNTGLKVLTMAEVKDRGNENHRLSEPDLSNQKYKLELLDQR